MRQSGVAFYAASIDDPETNRKFAESLDLDYPILSDPGKETARAFGVLKIGGLYAARHTIYIGSDGKIVYIDRDVSVKTAGPDMLEKLKELGL